MKDSSQIRKRTTKIFSILYKESLKIKSYFLCEWETFSSENNFNVEKIFRYENITFQVPYFNEKYRQNKNGKQLGINVCNPNDKRLVFELFYIFYMSIRNWNSLIKKKWVMKMNRNFTKVELQMISKHIKIFSLTHNEKS